MARQDPSAYRRVLKRVPGLRRGFVGGRRVASLLTYLAGKGIRNLPLEDQVRLAYEVMVRREVDTPALQQHTSDLALGNITIDDLVDRLRCSDEHRVRTPIGPATMLASLHLSRCEFILGLPAAKVIVDLGGSHTHDPAGALVLMGYPYDFDSLTIVDLPPEGRHELYQSERYEDIVTPRGPVTYRFHSMTDLSFCDDESVDLVYSGQTFEHVTEDEGRVVLKEVHRILRPGGFFAVDTPNGPVCRLDSPDFIDPDHKIEYSFGQLKEAVEDAGLAVVAARGLNLAVNSRQAGRLDRAEVAANPGVFFAPDDCYLLALICTKPATPRPA